MLDARLSQAEKLINLTSKVNSEVSSSKTKLLTITSGKGGVGKSTFTANFAYILSQKNLRVLVLDADIGLANMQVLFDVKPVVTLFDYINGHKKLQEVIIETKYPNLSLIAGKSGYQYATNSSSFIFSRLVQDILDLNFYDILIVDTGAGLNDYVKEFLKVSTNILAITSTDPSALTDVYSLIKMLAIDKKSLMLCFNHTKNDTVGETISNSLINLAKKNRLKSEFVIKYIGSVPSSENITKIARARRIFVNEFPQEEASFRLHSIVDRVLKNI